MSEIKKPDFRLYKEETTEYWSEGIRARAGKLFGVYIFDANRHVHAAELTPSYEMVYVGPTWTGHVENEEESQRLFEDILKGDSDTEGVKYVHVHGLDLTKCETVSWDDAAWDRMVAHHDGDTEDAHKEALEKAIEHCRGNGVVY